MFVGQIPLFAAKPRPQEAFDQGEEPLPVPRVTQMSAMRLGPRVAIGPKKGGSHGGVPSSLDGLYWKLRKSWMTGTRYPPF